MVYREGVCCIGFTENKGKIYLIKRKDFGIWYLPGGGMNEKEPPEDAAAREFREETGLGIKIKTFHGRYDIKIIPNFPIFHDRTYLFSGIITGGEITLNPEAKEIKEFKINNLPKGLPFYHKRFIHDALKGIRHKSIVQQQVRLRDLGSLLIFNPQIITKIPSLIKKLTISSFKK